MIQHDWIKRLAKDSENVTTNLLFNEKVVLVCIRAIRFASIKVTEAGKVSLSVYNQIDEFISHAFRYCLQVYSTYRVADSLREAIKKCPDITTVNYPLLFVNKSTSKTTGNISRISHKQMKIVCIFIGRIYESVRIQEQIDDQPDTRFNFERFPVLKECFDVLEEYLSIQSSKPEPKPATKKNEDELIRSITSDLHTLETHHEKMDEKIKMLKIDVAALATKIKKRSVKRKRDETPDSGTVPVPASDAWFKAMMEKHGLKPTEK